MTEDSDAEVGGQRLAPTAATPRPDRRSGGGPRAMSRRAGTGAGSGNPARERQARRSWALRPWLRPTSRRFADVDEPDRLRLAALLRDVAEGRASCVQATTTSPAARPAKAASSLLAQHRPHFRGAGELERARQRRRIDEHRAVAASRGGRCLSAKLVVHLGASRLRSSG